MGKVLLSAFFALLSVLPFAAAQSVLSEGAINFWSTWFYVPVKYLATWQSLLIFAVAPVVVALFFAHEIWEELGIFHSGGANFWIPMLVVYIMLPNGFWGYVDLFVSNTQMIPALVLSFFAMQVMNKLKKQVTSFGYSGIFGGIVGFALEAISTGIFLGGIGFIISKGRFGSLVYTMFFIGAGLGVFFMWLDMKSRKGGNLKNLMSQERDVEIQIERLRAEIKRLNDLALKETKPYMRDVYYRQMGELEEKIRILRGQREAVDTQLEFAH